MRLKILLSGETIGSRRTNQRVRGRTRGKCLKRYRARLQYFFCTILKRGHIAFDSRVVCKEWLSWDESLFETLTGFGMTDGTLLQLKNISRGTRIWEWSSAALGNREKTSSS